MLGRVSTSLARGPFGSGEPRLLSFGRAIGADGADTYVLEARANAPCFPSLLSAASSLDLSTVKNIPSRIRGEPSDSNPFLFLTPGYSK